MCVAWVCVCLCVCIGKDNIMLHMAGARWCGVFCCVEYLEGWKEGGHTRSAYWLLHPYAGRTVVVAAARERPPEEE
uniref:Putative secreted protein n=1 Tax=Anopheles marajoara TaxID=58244 RepID=A0A2M4CCR5_9DIPT